MGLKGLMVNWDQTMLCRDFYFTPELLKCADVLMVSGSSGKLLNIYITVEMNISTQQMIKNK